MVKHSGKIAVELFRSICSAFENLTFAAVEQEREGASFEVAPPETLYSCDIHIKNSGTVYLLKLIIPKEYLDEIYSTIYPEGGNDDDSGIMDILAEMTNTIAGHLMLNIEKITGPFELGLPEVVTGKRVDEDPFIEKKYLVDDTHVVIAAIYDKGEL